MKKTISVLTTLVMVISMGASAMATEVAPPKETRNFIDVPTEQTRINSGKTDILE